MTEEIGYSMKAVARQTGLTPHVIRVWERRYRAVCPRRTSTNRRIYNEAEVNRLTLLKRAVEAGHGIGLIATLPDEKLELLSAGFSTPRPDAGPAAEERRDPAEAEDMRRRALACIQALEVEALLDVLNHAAVTLGNPALIESLVLPLIQCIGDLWEQGDLRVANEHMATGVIRTFLGGFLRDNRQIGEAPGLVVATPQGQAHELGALAAAVTASTIGWRVTYLGANLPAEEIAAAAAQNDARAVALSIIYPPGDPGLLPELKRLHAYLQADVRLVVGGLSADSYRSVLDSIEAMRLPDMAALRSALSRSAGGRRSE